MLSFDIRISNPWSTDCSLRTHISKYWKISKNKGLEVQLYRASTRNLIRFHVGLDWRGCDHAGPEIEFEIFGYELDINIQDKRHWCYITNDWEIYID